MPGPTPASAQPLSQPSSQPFKPAGLASRMCEVSGITAPEGSAAKLGVAWMLFADSG